MRVQSRVARANDLVFRESPAGDLSLTSWNATADQLHRYKSLFKRDKSRRDFFPNRFCHHG